MLCDVVVIGSGPAAMTALIYLARAQLKAVVFTGVVQGGQRGGQLMTTTEVENYPGFPLGITGPELMLNMETQVKNYDVTFIEEDVIEVELGCHPFILRGTSNHIQSQAVIVATGAYAKRLSGVPGDKELWGKGITACATCDGPLPIYRKKPVAVIGGGDSACEEALFMTKYASKVIMILRRDKFRASKIMEERVKSNPMIEIIFNYEVQEISGSDFVERVHLKHASTLEVIIVEVSGVFYGLGHTPSAGFVNGQVEMDDEGYIVRKPGTSHTSVEGVFAAGDVTDKRYKQAVTAAGMGCAAAMDAEKWIAERYSS